LTSIVHRSGKCEGRFQVEQDDKIHQVDGDIDRGLWEEQNEESIMENEEVISPAS
jgi:hypothetical protein